MHACRSTLEDPTVWPAAGIARRGAAAAAVYTACLAVSIGVEFLQVFFPSRTASYADIAAQAIGSAIGIAAWVLAGEKTTRWFGSLPQVRGRGDVAARLLTAYLFLLIVYNLLPLDLTLSPVEIYHKWSEGRIVIVPFGHMFGDRAEQLYGILTDVAVWVPVAFLWRLSSTRPKFPIWVGTVSAAVGIEFLQLFVYSRVSDATDIVLAGVGAALGIVLATALQQADRPRAARFERSVGRPTASRPLSATAGRPLGTPNRAQASAWPWLAAALFWLVVLAVVFWYPFNFDFDRGFLRERLLTLKRMPLQAYWGGSEFRAVTEVLHKTGFMFPAGLLLGGMASGLVARLPRVLVHAAMIAVIAVVAGVIEVGQIALPGKTADLTDWILEVCGGTAGYFLLLAIRKRWIS